MSSTIELNKDIKQTCDNCLYLATHEGCSKKDGTGSTNDCLGSTQEVDANNGVYLYRNWKAGDGIERIRQWEKEGKVNIVIGGIGEAEVNVKWTPEQALESLVDVSEQCGYVTCKGKWTTTLKEIYIVTDGEYKLVYWQDKLSHIEKINRLRIWEG